MFKVDKKKKNERDKVKTKKLKIKKKLPHHDLSCHVPKTQ